MILAFLYVKWKKYQNYSSSILYVKNEKKNVKTNSSSILILIIKKNLSAFLYMNFKKNDFSNNFQVGSDI
jgi:hypothetical protein